MGGDDLESDDEYLKPSLSNDQRDRLDDQASDSGDEAKEPASKRRKVSRDPAKQLVLDGRSIANKTLQEQADFLTKAMSHHLPTMQSRHQITFEPKQFCKSSSVEGHPSSFLSFLKSSVTSMKRLKKHKKIGSPLVLVVCVSARRAVSLLKEVAPLKVRAAKLFAKHMTMEEQNEVLQRGPFGLAVGTPHRLLQLMGCSDDEAEDQEVSTQDSSPALSLRDTELLIVDNHNSHKGFTVCTLNDTAKHCMTLLRQAVGKRSDVKQNIKIALF